MQTDYSLRCVYKCSAQVFACIFIQDDETALYIASREGHRQIVEQLLRTEHTNVSISNKVRHSLHNPILITKYSSTLYVGIAMAFVFSLYIWIFSFYFHFLLLMILGDRT